MHACMRIYRFVHKDVDMKERARVRTCVCVCVCVLSCRNWSAFSPPRSARICPMARCPT